MERVSFTFNSLEPQYIRQATSTNIINRILKYLDINDDNFKHLL